LSRGFSDSRYGLELCIEAALASPVSVMGNPKPVRFVSKLLDDLEGLGTFVQIKRNWVVWIKKFFKALGDAAKGVMDNLGSMKAAGGLIALDSEGNMAMVFNTIGMYRAYITVDGTMEVRFYEMED
jgi:hypothetical protein